MGKVKQAGGVNLSFDWRAVPQHIRIHVYSALLKIRPENLPPEVVAHFDTSFRVNADINAIISDLSKNFAKQKIEFLTRGADRPTMFSLFSCTRREVDDLRQQLNLPKVPHGRKKNPNDDELKVIRNEFDFVVSETNNFDLPQAIILLHEKFPQYNISTLFEAIDVPAFTNNKEGVL